jgi:hypothetical protein
MIYVWSLILYEILYILTPYFQKHIGNNENGDMQEERVNRQKKDALMDEFTRKFKAMKDDQKWVLTDGMIVEDELFKFGLECSYGQ